MVASMFVGVFSYLYSGAVCVFYLQVLERIFCLDHKLKEYYFNLHHIISGYNFCMFVVYLLFSFNLAKPRRCLSSECC